MVGKAWILWVLTLVSCAGRTVAYPYASVHPGVEPVHRLRVAVLPFRDARRPDDGEDGAESFSYEGIDFAHTRLAELSGPAGWALTEIFAQHLARARVFSQLILVREESDAPEADLILSADLVRARGYVEAGPRKAKGGKPLDERTVIAEVVIADLELYEPRAPHRRLLRSDFGWSILEERRLSGAPIDPWSVLTEALFATHEQVVQVLAHADLSGDEVVRAQVALPQLADTSTQGSPLQPMTHDLPPGWRFSSGARDVRPIGWKGGPATCAEGALVQAQTQRFHRALGPYQPTLRLWACSQDVALEFDAKSEFPAQYLGRRADGVHYFALMLGQSNWPGAVEQVTQRLRLAPPPRRHWFSVGGDR